MKEEETGLPGKIRFCRQGVAGACGLSKEMGSIASRLESQRQECKSSRGMSMIL